MNWMLMPYRRYADFSGRSQRMEFWMFTLFFYIVMILMVGLMLAGMPWGAMDQTGDSYDPNAAPGALFWVMLGLLVVFVLGSLIPSIAVTVRRFHDQDKSGWFYLLSFIPYIGGIVIIVFMCIDGTRGPNQHGPDPKDPHTADVFG
jgi:uncharacterized membrane protein YhaH (DUF805 family)